jgi:hypothetical protein
MANQTRWVRTSVAAAEVGLSSEKMRRMCVTGEVRAHRWGREWRVDIEALRAQLDTDQTPTEARKAA